jgi:tetratricopeptide (TPR) repeat protein
MTRTKLLAAVSLTLAGLVALPANAWGPNAQQAITFAALQLSQRYTPAGLRPYNKDVLRGSQDGQSMIADVLPINNHQQAIEAIGRETQLLRSVRDYGMGSYYAYRMGVVAALVSDVMLPYGIAFNPQDQALQEKIEQDIENTVKHYRYVSQQTERTFIRHARLYFESRANFMPDAMRIVANDYQRGAGYQGYMKEAAPAFFARSIDAIADVWYTILRTDSDVGDVAPSKSQVAWYFVKEMEYLLREKDNLHQALETYENFEQLNAGIMETYEKLGDLFYAYGDETNDERALDRGVREWRSAFEMGGPNRQRVATKLAKHYLEEGKVSLEKGTQRGASETDLPNALRAFQQALEYNRGSDDAAQFMRDTNAAIKKREEQFNMNMNIIATADRVREEAEREFTAGNFGGAITTYEQAASLYGTVDDMFPQLATQAEESRRDLEKKTRDVIQQVLETASAALDAGDRMVEEHRYEEAISSYQKVQSIVNVIPENVSTSLRDEKQQLIDTAGQKVDEAKIRKTQYEEAQKAQQNAANRR